jgi:hypothetical protein
MRKRGKPRKVMRKDSKAALRLLSAGKPMENEHQLNIGLNYRMAFQSLCSLHAKEEDFHNLAFSINIALILAEMGLGKEWIEQVKAAQVGLMRCLKRSEDTGRWGLDGDAIQLLKEVMKLHDEQLEEATQKQIAQAMQEMLVRLGDGDVIKLEK